MCMHYAYLYLLTYCKYNYTLSKNALFFRLNTLFWTDNSEYPSIWRSNLDGTGAIPMVTSNISSPGIVESVSDNAVLVRYF